MKKLKITSKERIRDRKTGEYLEPGTIIERDDTRAQDFLNAKVASEVGAEKKPQTLDEFSDEVAKAKSADQLQKLADAEKAGQDRKGAYDLIEKRKAELAEASKESETKTAPKESKPKTSSKKK